MGRRSRRRRYDEEKATSQKSVRRYLRQIGVPRDFDTTQVIRRLTELHGAEYARRLSETMHERSEGNLEADPYPLLFTSADAAIVASGLVNNLMENYLTWLDSSVDMLGPVVDLGCGAGIGTCFIALCNPEVEVLGIDSSSEAVAAATEISGRLKIENATFRQASVFDRPDRTYSTVTAITLASNADPSVRLRSGFSQFSELEAVEQALMVPPAEIATAITRWAASDASIISIERLPKVSELARWWSSLEKCGWKIEIGTSEFVSDRHGRHSHRWPALYGNRVAVDSCISSRVVIDWWLSGTKDESLEKELVLAQHEPLTAIATWIATHGAHQSVTQLLKGGDGSMIGWHAKADGTREILGLTLSPSPEEFEQKRKYLADRLRESMPTGSDLREIDVPSLLLNMP